MDVPPVVRVARSLRNRLDQQATRLRNLRVRVLGALGLLRAGPGLEVGRGVTFALYGDLVLGARVRLDDRCRIEVGPGARVEIGNDVYIGRGTVISAGRSVEIGDHVLVAEYCSIRDSDHHVDPDERRHETAAVSAPVRIERDVWLGAGVRVLRGSRIAAGSIVGANAVVRGNIPERSLAVGMPARVVRTL